MVQWNRKDRTLFAKVVYYGPAFGGKTTNLAALHRMTDPRGDQQLLAVQTSDDRTLFFDLLPFDLGDILGYQVALKLFTVPGQVRYETTRQVVLAGADAIVFVADSSPGREEQNRWSLQNLRMNMRAKSLDPARVPVIYQFNKQDLPEAAPPEEVAQWLRTPVDEGFPAVATRGEGVIETFVATTRIMLQRLLSNADERTRREVDARDLESHLDRAFGPILSQQRHRQGARGEGLEDEDCALRDPIVIQDDDLLQGSVQASLELGARLSGESARSARLEREAEAFRALSETLRGIGASFDGHAIVDSVLSVSAEILEARVVSLICPAPGGGCALGRIRGATADPLLEFPAGRRMMEQMLKAGRSCVVDELHAEIEGASVESSLDGLRAAAFVPVACEPPGALVVYAPAPDGRFSTADVRFLDTVAGHLAAGLQKARLHGELERRREGLEELVESRTRQLRRSFEERRALEQTKDRFLGNLSHEMKTPLTAILSAAVFLRDYRSNAAQRKEMMGAIVESGERLQGLLEDLFRLVNLDTDHGELELEPVGPRQLIEEAASLAGEVPVRIDLAGAPELLHVDSARLVRALANLLGNAVKFSPEGGEVEVRVGVRAASGADEEGDLVCVAVLDRGPGVREEDRDRIFSPFEQGGDPLTGKPSGSGLGLYEAKLVVRRHGGSLEHRPREGGGSEFRIEIPASTVGQEAGTTVGA